MSTLVSIATECNQHDAAGMAAHKITSLPIVVISPHNQCNCRCVMCDIWRIRQPEEISVPAFERLLHSFRELKVRWVAFTGGEPQLNSHLFTFARMLRSEGIRVTLLTAGLLLHEQADAVAQNIDDLIVSLDGPPPVHDRIRRVPQAFDRMRAGIETVRHTRPGFSVRGRCTVQKENRTALRTTIETAKEIGLQSISFLAADVTSTAFNHPEGWDRRQREQVVLRPEELAELDAEVEAMILLNGSDLDSGYVVESAERLRRIPRHFRACLGEVLPVSPRCNAPWHSAVIDASGNVRPCFFHPAYGNIQNQSIEEILNGAGALRFRREIDIPRNPVCQRCVCSLYVSPSVESQTKEPER